MSAMVSEYHFHVTRKQRIANATERKPLDRVPTDLWATVEVQERLFDYFGIETGSGEKTSSIGFNGGLFSRGLDGVIRLLDELDIDCIFHVSPSALPKTYEHRFERLSTCLLPTARVSYSVRVTISKPIRRRRISLRCTMRRNRMGG